MCVCVCVFDVLLYSVRMVWGRSREGAEQGGGGRETLRFMEML